jgi:hypothetical protein
MEGTGLRGILSERCRKLARRSKRKGKRGEKEIALLLSSHGWTARVGRHPEPDVVSDFPFAIEVKRNERLNIFNALAQIKQYCLYKKDHRPYCVVFRKNGDEWTAAIPLEKLIEMVRGYQDLVYGNKN